MNVSDVVGIVEARYWPKVDKAGVDECWPWNAGRHPAGYGMFYFHAVRRAVVAHRVGWVLAHERDIPEGKIICHRCDNPPCQNPAHLFLGTLGDNIRDAVNKDRQFSPFRGVDTCVNGHPFTPENTKIRAGTPGWRRCRECNREHDRRRLAKNRARH